MKYLNGVRGCPHLISFAVISASKQHLLARCAQHIAFVYDCAIPNQTAAMEAASEGRKRPPRITSHQSSQEMFM